MKLHSAGTFCNCISMRTAQNVMDRNVGKVGLITAGDNTIQLNNHFSA